MKGFKLATGIVAILYSSYCSNEKYNSLEETVSPAINNAKKIYPYRFKSSSKDIINHEGKAATIIKSELEISYPDSAGHIRRAGYFDIDGDSIVDRVVTVSDATIMYYAAHDDPEQWRIMQVEFDRYIQHIKENLK